MDPRDISTTNFDEQKIKIEFQHEMPQAVVYTTKLDEMNIFKENAASKCVDTIINSIIKESKPKFLKRKRPQTHCDYSYEDLSFYIQEFNRKVARVTKRNNRLLSLCRPVRVVLEDIKYSILQSNANKISEISEPISAYNFSRKLNVKIIYDQQLKEADMYYLDEQFVLQGYNKFRIDNMSHSLEIDNNVIAISCCCWYNRDAFLNTLAVNLNDTVRFMRKPHKCEVNRCRCCCRQKPMYKLNDKPSTSSSSLNPSEPPSEGGERLNKMKEQNVSLLISDKSRKYQETQYSKSLTVSKTKEKRVNHSMIEDALPFLHSTNIDFGEEYYVIGADGQIILHLRNYKREQNLPSLISKTTNNIVGDICCWYKREEFASRLLALHALPNTVNYIRGVHPCSPTFCSCCCMPSSIEKTEFTVLPKAARHTNDMLNKKVNIKVSISGFELAMPDDAEPDPLDSPDTTYSVENIFENSKDVVSFDVSLSAIDKVARGDSECFFSIITEHGSSDSVRVFVDKSRKHSPVIKCTRPLYNFSTRELRMLDIIFRAVNNATKQVVVNKPEGDELKTNPKPTKVRVPKYNYTMNTIYPLLLNTQISISSDLRNKRFMPPLQARLDKYNLPRIGHISTWLIKELANDKLT